MAEAYAMTAIKAIDGLPVLDATEPLHLNITARDIRAADPKVPGNCAIARACKRELHVLEARVHLSRIYLRTNDHNWVRYQTPTGLRSEIIAFDRGGAFEPGEVILPMIPSREIKSRGKRVGGKDQAGRAGKGKKRKAPHVMKNVRSGPA